MSETAISKAIREAVNAQGIAYVVRVQSGKVQVRGGWMHAAPPGTSDLLGFMLCDGRVVAIEVKDPSGKTNKERAELQSAFRAKVRAAGGIGFECSNPIDACAELWIRAKRSA